MRDLKRVDRPTGRDVVTICTRREMAVFIMVSVINIALTVNKTSCYALKCDHHRLS